jgi:hypothetical protein
MNEPTNYHPKAKPASVATSLIRERMDKFYDENGSFQMV